MNTWCSPAAVSFTRRAPLAAVRPPRALACRLCAGVITLRDPYYHCCRECPPVCSACWQAAPWSAAP